MLLLLVKKGGVRCVGVLNEIKEKKMYDTF